MIKLFKKNTIKSDQKKNTNWDVGHMWDFL